MKITVQYDPRYIKRMGYEGLTKQEIDKKEKERLQGSNKTYATTKKKWGNYMPKKLFSISEPLALRLEQVAKEQKTTQSSIIQASLLVYLMMDKGNNTISKQIQELSSKNQTIILKELDKIVKKD